MTEFPEVPQPPETTSAPPKWSKANRSNRALSEGKWWDDPEKLKQQANAGMLRAYGFIAVLIFIVVGLAAAAGIVSYAVEMLTPWGWLSDVQVGRIETFLSSGLVGVILGWVAKRHFENDKNA